MDYKNFFIGAGGCGGFLLNELINAKIVINPELQSFYYNTSTSDVVDQWKGTKLVLDKNGTGRSREVGRTIVQENVKEIVNALEAFYNKIVKITPTGTINLYILSSFGGGTGSSGISLILDYFSRIAEKDKETTGKDSRLKIFLLGVLSSPKEGLAVLPNSIGAFKEVYNNFVLTDKIQSTILFDNEKFEKTYKFNTYDFDKINKHIVSSIADILEENEFKKSTDGHHSLDLNEKIRVMNYGKGLADYSSSEVSIGDEYKLASSIYAGSYKVNSAKAVYVYIRFKQSHDMYSEGAISYAKEIVTNIRKKCPDAFFVHGYSFNHPELEKDLEVRVFLNGLECPAGLNDDVKVALKSIEKIKKLNNSFTAADNVDLTFG